MKKETLAKAKILEEDIRKMENALHNYKSGKWPCGSIYEDGTLFHFAFHKNYGDGYREDLPRWLNKPLMEVIERELERCKAQLAALSDDSEDGAETDIPSEITQQEEAACMSKSADDSNKPTQAHLTWCTIGLYAWMLFCITYGIMGFGHWLTTVSNTLFTAFLIYLVSTERSRLKVKKED